MLRGETNHQNLQFVSYQNVNDELQKKFLNLIASQMKIQKFSPSVALTPFIKAYVIIESDSEMHSHTLPDTSMVMAFRYQGNISKTDEQGRASLPVSSVAGLRKSSRKFSYARNTANLLVIFKEGGFASLSRVPAHELFGLSISNDNIFSASEVNEILERLSAAESDRMKIKIIEAFLFSKLRNHKSDLLVTTAIDFIRQHQGIIRIKDLAASLHISQDPFEKRFRSVVGSTPKQYASIVRLRSLLQNYSSYTSLTEASYAAGYFDQSHFIKDFRIFTGTSPKEFFKSGEFW
jgi:AraC-like DNA-binding protein